MQYRRSKLSSSVHATRAVPLLPIVAPTPLPASEDGALSARVGDQPPLMIFVADDGIGAEMKVVDLLATI
jgi:hypothetical protein